MRVVGYTRVSTAEQADHGVSLDAQTAKLQAYALVKDWELLEVIRDEGASAKSLQESLDATTATGRLMMNLLASVSQWEREVIGERTREALQHLKAQGKRYCHTVYADAAIIDRMHHMRAAGQSYAAIAAHLNNAGVPTALGRRWAAMTIWVIVNKMQPKRQRRSAS